MLTALHIQNFVLIDQLDARPPQVVRDAFHQIEADGSGVGADIRRS